MAKDDNTGLILFAAAAAAVGLFAVGTSEPVQEYIMEKTWDFVSDKNINRLHPKIRQQARNFINAAEKAGIQLRVISTLRTFEEQQALYDKGRKPGVPGPIVTNAKPGSSYHNYGLALDVVEIKDGKAVGFQKDYPLSRWDQIGQLGKKFGFFWGGDFKNFKDRPHFEMSFGKSVQDLLAAYNSKQLQDGYVIV